MVITKPQLAQPVTAAMEQLHLPAQACFLDPRSPPPQTVLVMVLALEDQALDKAQDQDLGKTQALVLEDRMATVGMDQPALARTTARKMQRRHCGDLN